ncbi:MAG TPA: ester cyclase [Steroidobacteraceae bacterium]|nr:ester cyclase [Steroidobacteraceae bacterium]
MPTKPPKKPRPSPAKAATKPKLAAKPAKPAKPTKPVPAPKPAQAAKPPKTAKPASPDNKAIYLKFIEEVLNAGNFSVAATYLAPDVQTHNAFPDQEPGLDGFVAALKAFHGAFPDLRANLTHAVAEGDLVMGRFEVTGTHRGPFLGMPGSGRKVHYEEFVMVRMTDGKIAEHWSVADALAIIQQLQTSEIV